MSRLVPSHPLRTVLLTALFTVTSLFVEAAPTELPIPRPEALTPQPALALGCSTEPSFEGHLTSSTSSTAVLTKSTTGNVYGYISNVARAWSCTNAFRYSGLAWARNDPDLDGNFAWGNLINSTSVACNWVVGTTDYLKGNSSTSCPGSKAQYALPLYLANTSDGTLLEWVFHNDVTPDEPGDFGFIHSDCTSYYGAAPIRYNQIWSSSGRVAVGRMVRPSAGLLCRAGLPRRTDLRCVRLSHGVRVHPRSQRKRGDVYRGEDRSEPQQDAGSQGPNHTENVSPTYHHQGVRTREDGAVLGDQDDTPAVDVEAHRALAHGLLRLVRDTGFEAEVSSGILEDEGRPAWTPIADDEPLSPAEERRVLRDLRSRDPDARMSALMGAPTLTPTAELLASIDQLLAEGSLHHRAFAAQAMGVLGDAGSADAISAVLTAIVATDDPQYVVAGMAAAIGLGNIALRFPDRLPAVLETLETVAPRTTGVTQERIRALVRDLRARSDIGGQSG